MTADLALDLVNKFLSKDMSLTEAFNQIGEDALYLAVNDAIDLEGVNHPFFKLRCEAGSEESHESGLDQCYELWMNGWKTETTETLYIKLASWSWSWRRPPKGNRKVGKLFPSTNQAYQAMKRES